MKRLGWALITRILKSQAHFERFFDFYTSAARCLPVRSEIYVDR